MPLQNAPSASLPSQPDLDVIRYLLIWFRIPQRLPAPVGRYRVTPRANPAGFRRELLQSVRRELRRSDLARPQAPRDPIF